MALNISLEFEARPTRDEFARTVQIARTFKAETKRGPYVIFEFTDIVKQIMEFLEKNCKGKPFSEIRLDMEQKAKVFGYLSTIGGKKVKNSKNVVNDYLHQSILDILEISAISVEKYQPIGKTDIGLIYSAHEFAKENTAEIMRQRMSDSCPLIKPLNVKLFTIA